MIHTSTGVPISIIALNFPYEEVIVSLPAKRSFGRFVKLPISCLIEERKGEIKRAIRRVEKKVRR